MQTIQPSIKETCLVQDTRTRAVNVEVRRNGRPVTVKTNVVNLFLDNGYFLTGWENSPEFEAYTLVPKGDQIEIEYSATQVQSPGLFGEKLSHRIVGVKTLLWRDRVYDFTSPVPQASGPLSAAEIEQLLSHVRGGHLLSPVTTSRILEQLLDLMSGSALSQTK